MTNKNRTTTGWLFIALGIALMLLAISGKVYAKCGTECQENNYDTPPATSQKPCMILVGQNLYINANTLSSIDLARQNDYAYGTPLVRYNFGRQEKRVSSTDVPKEIERVVALIKATCK